MNSPAGNHRLTAVMWDFDGTLADTSRKNFHVTRKIIERVTGRPAGDFPVLRSLSIYLATHRRARNWRELYIHEFTLTERQAEQAGRLWTAYQLADDTRPALYDGIADVLHALRHVPHGIVSQNARAFIDRTLERERLTEYFERIVGYEEVGFDRQKPAPDGLLTCLEAVTGLTPGVALYIGDHQTDVQCAANANAALEERCVAVRIVAVGALYGTDLDVTEWSPPPDRTARRALDILDIAAEFQ